MENSDAVRKIEFTAKRWMKEAAGGQKNLRRLIAEEATHEIERTGRKVRALMPYLDEHKVS